MSKQSEDIAEERQKILVKFRRLAKYTGCGEDEVDTFRTQLDNLMQAHTNQALQELKERVEDMVKPQVDAAEQAERIENEKSYPKITSTAHHQRAVAFKQVIETIENIKNDYDKNNQS